MPGTELGMTCGLCMALGRYAALSQGPSTMHGQPLESGWALGEINPFRTSAFGLLS